MTFRLVFICHFFSDFDSVILIFIGKEKKIPDFRGTYVFSQAGKIIQDNLKKKHQT